MGEDFLGSSDPIDDVIDVVGAEILPSSLYHLHVFPGSCLNNESLCPNVSCPLTITTARWGDVTAEFNPPSTTTTQPNVSDIEKVVSKLKSVPGALVKAITQLQPNLPDLNADVSALDLVAVMDGLKENAYAFSGPCPCPSAVTCGPARLGKLTENRVLGAEYIARNMVDGGRGFGYIGANVSELRYGGHVMNARRIAALYGPMKAR